MKKMFKWIAIILVVLFIIGLIAGTDDTTTTGQTAVSNDAAAEPVASETEVVAAVDSGMTKQQKNAVRSAKNYISFAGFSRDGLINQLSSDAGDGYNIDDATIAVDGMDIDYNEQAGKSASNYISIQGFSCDGLITQLSSPAGDKYTKEQAEYGAKLAGACD
ncbi:Ltp family lipoprotein [Psychrobacter sp. BF1]|uniref:Ltp family lipoprotein n=1 Tax=Psychrobacter sp. BF1 TaxID=2821147 RepID=UPI001C4DE698|nr:Ltp family lipoprotein [Psychrobacter sp. BF1]